LEGGRHGEEQLGPTAIYLVNHSPDAQIAVIRRPITE
jgi:hypothetical protein